MAEQQIQRKNGKTIGLKPRSPRTVKQYPPEAVRAAFADWFTDDLESDGEQRMYCPLCEDPESSGSPSASMNAGKGMWDCKGKGGEGGTIIALEKELNIQLPGGFKIAAEPLTTISSSEAKATLPAPVENPDKYQFDNVDLLRAPQGSKLMEFLLTERGLTMETLDRFQVGAMDTRRISVPIREGLRSARGVIRNVRQYLPHSKPDDAKWINLPGHGTPPMLAFTGELQANTHPVIFAEGEWDALLTNQKGVGNFVAVTGTGGAGNPPRDLTALRNRQVFIAYDCDVAGRKGSKKLFDMLQEVGAKAYIIDLTRLGLESSEKHGQDLTDYFMQGGTVERLLEEMERLRSARPERFKIVTAAELAQPVPPMRWLVKGVWPDGSYGVLAGEKKTLKTYTGLSLALAVASGEPFLGQFPVPVPRPVLMYLGEGGMLPTMRRLQALAAGMGFDLASLPLRMIFDSDDITGEQFLASLQSAVEETMPGLVIVDPFYAFHPSGVEAQNLYDRGAMLAQVQASMPPGCAFIIADHFRKTGSKDLDLDSIAQSGMAAWADSWILQNHDTPPRVDQGQFAIKMQFGSRQWGGREYVADWSIGKFNDEGEHEGDLSVAMRSVEWGAKAARADRTDNVVTALIITMLENEPLIHTQNSVRDRVKADARVGDATFNKAWDELLAQGRLVSQSIAAQERNRTVKRDRWKVVSGPSTRIRLHAGDPE